MELQKMSVILISKMYSIVVEYSAEDSKNEYFAILQKKQLKNWTKSFKLIRS